MFNESWLQLRHFQLTNLPKNHSSCREKQNPWKFTPWPLLQGLKALIEILGCYCDNQLIWRIYRYYYYIQGFIFQVCVWDFFHETVTKRIVIMLFMLYIFSISTCGILPSKGLSKVKKCQSVQLQPVEQCLEVSGSHSNSHFIGSLQ